MCVYIYICIYMCVCVCVCELPLLPNYTASGSFLHKSGAVRSVDWILHSLGRRPGGDWARIRDIGQNVLIFISNRKQ